MNDIEVIAGIGAIGTLGYMLYHWAHLRVGPPLAIKRRRIAALELDAVRDKATKRHGWDEGKAKVLESEYRDFLILLAENDGKTISPWSDDLDLFWHEHILDTRKYAQDCKSIFGHFIQHDPHIEKRPYRHEETRRATMALREAQLREREERRKAAESSPATATAGDGFDIATWGCSADTGSAAHVGSHGHSCGADGGGHSCGDGHSCGGHGCGGHGCGGHGCGGHGCGAGH
jgi:hypothetical protein